MSREIRAQVSLGFRAEPYSPAIRARAIEQHVELARAIAGQRADEAAAIAREHFLLTESALRELRCRVEEGDPDEPAGPVRRASGSCSPCPRCSR